MESDYIEPEREGTYTPEPPAGPTVDVETPFGTATIPAPPRTPHDEVTFRYLNHVNDCPVCDEDPSERLWGQRGVVMAIGRFVYCTTGRALRDEVVRTELLRSLQRAAL